ncbi:insulinase family protein [Paenalkalicoccus suaedae]|uniref:Insulinase family protein n=1 Tax=Paenalkalicoccus suaedae TaxID=2592382 RepID=A0A859FGN2_9BACI|nr:pitrilysin family protein [Paenalkalicoccus suaedae]QKS71376.1 insulinase family protein [Paenalkalicoccus suaedae]
MEKLVYEQLNETLYAETMSNGLRVFILPKAGFNKTYATFTTKYGSIDHHFTPIGETEAIKVPDGIAHFLEHKMFEDEEGDVFQTFSKQGASANAFTSFTRTAYLFSSTSHVEKNMDTLLDFVQHPYFTEESVEKEKGIIEQEIRMYEDNPDWQNFFGLLKMMYHTHPVATDIAGTVESIQDITHDMLYTCYHTFYHPNNMTLFVVGNVEPDAMMELIRQNQARKTFEKPTPIPRFKEEEPTGVKERELTIPMPVKLSKLLIGIKDKEQSLSGSDLMQREIAMQLLLELMFGQSSENYQTLYQEGLIDDTFGADYTAEEGFSFTAIGGDTDQPEVLSKRVLELIEAFKEKELDEESVERLKKKKIGHFLRALNSPEYIANSFTRYQFNDMDLFNVIPELEALTMDQLKEVVGQFDTDNQTSICIIKAKEDDGSGE